MNEIFICKFKKCNKYLVDPILLDCGNNVCRSHIVEMVDIANEIYNCFVCKEQHIIPNEGFMTNKDIVEMVSFNYLLNSDELKADALVNELKISYCGLERLITDPESYIYEYISERRNKIDLERERLIEEINSLSNMLLNELKILEEECMENLKAFKQELINQKETYLNNLSNDVSIWNDMLRTPNNDADEIKKLIEKAQSLIKQTNDMILSNQKILLMNKVAYFSGANKKVDEKIFGDYYIGLNMFSKSSILTPKQTEDLIKLCKLNFKSKLNLIYQATKDGFSSERFHLDCDDIPNTLTIVKAKESDNIFGGFCKETWNSFGIWKADPKAFLFSLINKENKPSKVDVTNSTYAINCSIDYGPAFGLGDLCISSNSNTNRESFSSLGNSFSISDLNDFYSVKYQNFLAGSTDFLTEEIEVYQVI